jgi:hypothetical protein
MAIETWAPEKMQNAINELHQRIHKLDLRQAQAEFQILNLTEQVQALTTSRKAEEADGYRALRRAIKAVALAEVIWCEGWVPEPELPHERDWLIICTEAYRRYGGPELGLWTQPPGIPSDKTKALVRMLLERRQER